MDLSNVKHKIKLVGQQHKIEKTYSCQLFKAFKSLKKFK